MHANDCWTCRDSRAVCTRRSPRCSRCARSNRPCQYGLRLSWPKATNKKRSLTYLLRNAHGRHNFTQEGFLNATSWDIRLHHYLRMNQGHGSNKGFALERLDPPMELSCFSTSVGYEEREQLDHFIHVVSSTLAIFEPKKNEFLGLLVRLALSDNSPSSTAVLQSALALSAFYRHGPQADVFRLKARALRALVVSSNQGSENPTIVQHIAASMLLCHLEMLGMPNELSLWFCHLNEARRLIDNAGHNSKIFQGEPSRLLHWVEYHMIMSQFSHRHWHINIELFQGIKSPAVKKKTCLSQKIKRLSHCSNQMLGHLDIMFEMIRKPADSLYHSEEYEKSLLCLENRISNIDTLAPEGISDDMPGSSTDWVAAMELFKLTALIYLKRASRNFSGNSPQIDEMIYRCYILLDDLNAFSPAFPLLIIGCEARTDQQRMRILEHIRKAMRLSTSRSLQGLRNILQKIWIQDDLAVEHELDYLSRLDGIISSYRIMPSFV